MSKNTQKTTAVPKKRAVRKPKTVSTEKKEIVETPIEKGKPVVEENLFGTFTPEPTSPDLKSVTPEPTDDFADFVPVEEEELDHSRGNEFTAPPIIDEEIEEVEEKVIMPGSLGDAVEKAKIHNDFVAGDEPYRESKEENADLSKAPFNETEMYNDLQSQNSTKEKVVYGDSKRKPNDLLACRLARQAERNGK
jgi:hypothetical protein